MGSWPKKIKKKFTEKLQQDEEKEEGWIGNFLFARETASVSPKCPSSPVNESCQ